MQGWIFFVPSDVAVRALYVVARLSVGKSTWWFKWYVPQAVGFVTVAFYDYISVFNNTGVVFC